jgi:hypothetical protein
VGIGLNKPTLEFVFYIYLTLLLSALAGVCMGLAISALNKNSDRATSFVPVLLIPQIIFSGAVVSLSKIGVVGTFLSNLMVTRWGFEAVGKLTELDKLPSPRVRFNGPPPEMAKEIVNLFKGGITYDPPDFYLIPRRDNEFTLSVYANWGILGLIIVVSLLLIFVFQLLKDRDYSR